MKYSLKNEYKELLNEELATVVSPTTNYEDRLYNLNFSENGTVTGQIANQSDFDSLEMDSDDVDVYFDIIKRYSTMSKSEFINLYKKINAEGENKFRIVPRSPQHAIEHLNNFFLPFSQGENKKADRVGIGELSAHLGLKTNNFNNDKEPDVVLNRRKPGESGRGSMIKIKLSVKNVQDSSGLSRGAVRTGEAKQVQQKMSKYVHQIQSHLGQPTTSSITKGGFATMIQNFINDKSIPDQLGKLQDVLALISTIKSDILKENNSNGIIIWTGSKFIYINDPSLISLHAFVESRFTFGYTGSSRPLVPYEKRSDVADIIKQQVGSERLTGKDIEPRITDKYPNADPEIIELLKQSFLLGSTKKAENEFQRIQNSDEALLNKIKSQLSITSKTAFGKAVDNLHPQAEVTGYVKKKDRSPIISLKGISETSDWSEIVAAAISEIQKDGDDEIVGPIDFDKFTSQGYRSVNSYNLETSGYIPKGKALKEVYSHLFKKKLISEGGLAGHMMHPYEALDMTPRQIIDRIKEYSTSQKIIEKVDGQNLFFTVEQDGTLMFARNKADMTHNDLVEKFTNHPAEVPFVTGGNAIKKGVDQWLSSAGAFGQQEILDIFHPDGEARSFINFEIMHKDHPNQLEYGENFIVFHSIVDFVNGRETVYSSNNSQRLEKLIKLMKQGIESSGYTLASNRTVDLNKLTNVQILSYIKRVKEIADQLEITDSEFLGDGVEKQIKKQLDAEGIDISNKAIKILYDFALYGEDRSGNKIKSKDFTSLMQPEDVKKLRAIDLTNANKAAAKVRRILAPFKEVFVDLGIDLLDGVPSAYMDSETDLANIDRLRDKLETAMEDLRLYMSSTPESNWDAEVNRLKEHYDKIVEVGVYRAVSTSVEGGVYDFEGDLLKVTGGFAPLNQILGAAYRDKKGIFPSFKEKFMQQESNRRSLKGVFNLIF